MDSNTLSSHASRVTLISDQVKSFHARNQKFRIYHGSTNSTRRAKWRRSEIVDTSSLTHVLSVQPDKRLVVVEPNVPMDALVAATAPYGLMPPVVPEFPGITVGGAVVGSAGESSSFRYGLVDATVESVRIVLATGDCVTASADENADLFAGIGSSFGTLGVLVQVTLRLVPAGKYVAVTYHAATSFGEACAKVLNFARDPEIDFVDGIVFKREKSVIVTGKMTDEIGEGVKVRRFSRARDQWFYVHARRQFSTTGETRTDLVPLADYLFRYDRGGFWTGRYAFRYFKVPFDRFSRFMMDWYMHTRVLYHALHESGLGDQYIVQDLALPRDRAEEFLDYCFDELKIHPLWICPLKSRPTAVMNPRSTTTPAEAPPPSETSSDTEAETAGKGYPEIINIGAWGEGSPDRERFIQVNRELERKVRDLGGIKWLYAQTFYTEAEFWDIYDRAAYDALRERYSAQGLPTVYDKVRLDVERERREREQLGAAGKVGERLKRVWPVRGVYGVAKTILGKDYLLDTRKEKAGVA